MALPSLSWGVVKPVFRCYIENATHSGDIYGGIPPCKIISLHGPAGIIHNLLFVFWPLTVSVIGVAIIILIYKNYNNYKRKNRI